MWQALSTIDKTLVFFFGGVFVYSIYLSLRVLFAIHQVQQNAAEWQSENVRLGIFSRRLRTLQQLHLFALYAFGFGITIQILNAFRTIALSYDIPFQTITRTLIFVCHVDATIFLTFLIVHSLQWLASARLDSFQNPDRF
jgi:hypothetical protein